MSTDISAPLGAIYARLSDREAGDISPERQIEKVLVEYRKRGIRCRATKTLAILARHRELPPRNLNELIHRDAPDEDIFVEDMGRHSGRSLKRRPEFKRLMAAVETGKYQFVAVDDSQRTARNSDDFFGFMRLLQANGAQYIDVNNPALTLDTALGLLMARITAAFSEFIPNKQSEDQKKNIAYWKSQGAFWGKPSLGLQVAGRGKERRLVASNEGYYLVTLPDGTRVPVAGSADAPPFRPGASTEWRLYLDFVAVWFDLFARDVRGRPVMLKLAQDKWLIRDQQGYPRVPRYHDLKRLIYRTFDNYRGILDDTLMQRVDAVRTRGTQYGARARKHPLLLLTKLLYCAACGKPFLTFYRHDGSTCYNHTYDLCDRSASAKSNVLDDLFWNEVAPLLDIPKDARPRIAARMAEAKRAPDPTADARAELDKRKARVKRLYRDNLMDDAEYANELQNLQSAYDALAALQAERAAALPFEQAMAKLDDMAQTLHETADRSPADANALLQELVRGIYVASAERPDRYNERYVKYNQSKHVLRKPRVPRDWRIVKIEWQPWARPLFEEHSPNTPRGKDSHIP